jgi:peptidase A4-like protein
MAVIKIDKGATITTFPLPPSDFDPLTASPGDLVRYGHPPRPDDPKLLARYHSFFTRLKGKTRYIEPAFKVDTTKTTHIQPPKATAGTTAGTETSGNWSGGVVYAPTGQSFKWVQGDWVCPNVYAPTQNQAYYNVNWIGIDGDGSGDVCQAGMVCEVTNNSRTINPWHEWYPSSWVNITNLTILPGDLISMLICTAGAGSTSATIYFGNVSSGLTTSYTITAPTGTKLVGNSAEWIVETPGINGQTAQMPDYGEVFFSTCQAGLTNGSTVNGGTGNNINLVQGGNTLSTGTLITPTIIQCQYTGAHP